MLGHFRPGGPGILSTGREWPKLRSVLKVVGRRETAKGTEVQPRYYISSLEAPTQRLLQTVRRHWSIENSLHWTLDVAFREDQCRVRKDHAPQNMALLISHNLLKNETSLKVHPGQTAPGRFLLVSPPRFRLPWRMG